MKKRVYYRELLENNIPTQSLPDDTEIIIEERHPRYILEPFRIVFKEDPDYEKGLTLREALELEKNENKG